MLFNSPTFVLGFLPVVLVGFFATAYLVGQRAAMAWLVVVSFVFYGYFRFEYVFLLAGLIVGNFYLGEILLGDARHGARRRWLLALAIVANLAVLFYFKYTNFALDIIDEVFGASFSMQAVLLPLGISFFIFQKVAYLVDSYNGERADTDLLDFALFVSFFPQLVAGPIVHHKEMMPQFREAGVFRFNAASLATGLALFTIGLAKKVLLADTLAPWADTAFATLNPDFFVAWTGALAFTLQIYFDFSGYTDMALGLALMIGIRLPPNFDSPYQARSIIDFWRRWHMTLSRFLRDYVYIPLGGNRKGSARRYVNLFLTMLIGGLWHGAAWTFVFWGALHGLYLVINHAWRHATQDLRPALDNSRWYGVACLVLTFFVVVLAWTFFRAVGFPSAWGMLGGMLGLQGFVLPAGGGRFPILLVLVGAVWLLPNSLQIVAGFNSTLERQRPLLGPSVTGLIQRLGLVDANGTASLRVTTGYLIGFFVLGILLVQAVRTTTLTAFIYFQF
jgi:alginate O-acetyltransferase complex protein AlgI